MSLIAGYHKEERPWGYFEQFTENEVATVKILAVHPHSRFSLQRHAHRSEYWRVLKGGGVASIGGEEIQLTPGNDVVIPVGEKHRITAGPEGIEVLEIVTGGAHVEMVDGGFDENDIERFEDDFGRV